MIVDGNVTARGDYGSGIGSGFGEYGESIVLHLTIFDGNNPSQIQVHVVP
jgi:hypothetical protein